ncbi:hypothetical protein K503DRAFT_855107 [Rhizopogon vinicolor AM-OR11-026]|uniref:Uncharacterized protein n=1 Tax=Rhizopogon vinicolor AM-OR11-026 TaxID=1314800 RepID=A0A1B7N7E8_9AGAM|nr:hypothetical protein K503DRAFT_855107 [Rhizopogon vinicolor AM-OR11-026]
MTAHHESTLGGHLENNGNSTYLRWKWHLYCEVYLRGRGNGAKALSRYLVHAVERVAAANLTRTQCLNTIQVVQNANVTHDLTGLLNGDGQPVSDVSDAKAISYWLCASASLLCSLLFPSNGAASVDPHYSGIFARAATDGQTVGYRKLLRSFPGDRGAAHAVIIKIAVEAAQAKSAWIGALVMAHSTFAVSRL